MRKRWPLLIGLLPSLAHAHERWVPHQLKYPVNKSYFQSMTGEVLTFSLMSTVVIACIVAAWYLVGVPLLETITPITDGDKAYEASRPRLIRLVRLVMRFCLDGEIESPLLEKLEKAAAWWFAKLPALVLSLGVYQNWIIMPSYPLDGSAGPSAQVGFMLRIVEGILAVWVISGMFYRVLGAVLFAVYGFLCMSYGIAAVDAIPVLASAFYYLFYTKGHVNARQITGLRISLGAGFFLLGLVNKIYIAELFIGVGDNFPMLVEASRHMIPGLTREGWSFTTALGEMTFGLLLLVGVFSRLTTIALTFIFGQLIFVFGPSEIVHLYPIAGFLILLFHAPPGTVLDGIVFRTHVGLWSLSGRRVSPYIFGLSLAIVAIGCAALLMFTPLLFTMHILPRI
jgi:hypothetical protein